MTLCTYRFMLILMLPPMSQNSFRYKLTLEAAITVIATWILEIMVWYTKLHKIWSPTRTYHVRVQLVSALGKEVLFSY
jgi:hypothetical protein